MKQAIPAPTMCAVYARVSTDMHLSQEFNSIDAQIESCKHHINAHAAEGWTLAGIYKDEGISGSTTERPGLQQMLEDIRHGKINVVVVYKIDRLSRNLRAFLEMQAMFTEHEATMASVTEPYDTSTYMGRAMLNLLGVFAEMERERIRERITDKLAATRAKGYWGTGHPPFGYKLEKGLLIIVPEQADMVRDMFKMRSEGKFALEISSALNKAGRFSVNIKTGESRRWERKRVCEILRNPVYAGYIPHHGKRYEGQQERIDPRELWETVQQSIDAESNGRTKEQNSPMPFPLRGILYCGSCGSRMTTTYTRRGRGTHRYYICSERSKHGNSACPCPNLPADQIETIIKDKLAGIVSEDTELAAAVVELLPDINPQLVGDCVYNISKLLTYLSDDELEGVFNAVLSKVTYTPETSTVSITKK